MSGEALEVTRHVVDEIVGVEDALVPTEDEMGRREKGKVPLQLTEFWAEGFGKLHRGGGDEDFIAA